MKSFVFSVRKKLVSNKGASLIFALLFFVICGALGTMVLSAATTASGRTSGVIKNNQDLNTIISASTMFEKKWRLGKITCGVDEDGNITFTDSIAAISGEDIFYNSTFIGQRDSLVKEMYEANNSINTFDSVSQDFYISVEDDDNDPNNDIKDVKATATVYPDYTIIVEFRVIEPEGDDGVGSVALRFDPILTEADEEGMRILAWNRPQLLIGGPFNE